MRVLIIGGTGLISTPLTRYLLERGDEVVLFNRGKTEARIPTGAKCVIGDRREFATFENTVRELGWFDVVVDMVCFKPDEAESVVRAFAGRCGQVVFCSTVDVYAKPPASYPVREDQYRAAIGDYGINKVKCEDVFFQAHYRGDFPVTIIRPAHTYGEGGMIIHTFGWSPFPLKRLREGKPIIVHGDGQSLWVSCHVDDVAMAFFNALGNSAAFGKAYHTTGEEWNSWDRYHEIIAQALGAPKPKLVHIPAELLVKASDDCWVTYLNFQYTNIFDNTAANRDLGFQPTISLLEGAKRNIAWMDAKGMIEYCPPHPKYDTILSAWETLGSALVKTVKG
ncbi:MAG: NAD-dependent epimerase/dehydratase family protein [Verrucomicrobiota bacterium]|nr:NAD-dependent epimerase/dehydratase family protein [Verrucomicrobiota bacterium]